MDLPAAILLSRVRRERVGLLRSRTSGRCEAAGALDEQRLGPRLADVAKIHDADELEEVRPFLRVIRGGRRR